MYLGSILLMHFLMIFSISLKVAGDVASSEVDYQVLGQPGFLSIPPKEVTPDDIKWQKSVIRLARFYNGNLSVPDKEKHDIFKNGTLKINKLKKGDEGQYTVEGYIEGTRVFEHTITLYLEEPFRTPPQLFEDCSNFTLTCEVKYNSSPKPNLKLFEKNKEQQYSYPGPVYFNGMWKVQVAIRPKFKSGKFRCEASTNSSKEETEKEINCSVPKIDMMFIYLSIGGGVVVLIICVALVIHCIRRKRTRRLETEAEERELQSHRDADNALKQRKLPQPPVHAALNQPQQQYRPLPPRLEGPQQAAPPQPRPRPHQQKPPRRMKERS